MKRTLLLAMSFLLLAALPALAADQSVAIGDNTYTPPGVTVQAGDTVTWTHGGQNPHSVTADDGSFDSSPSCSGTDLAACMQNGDTFAETFDTAGTFPYYCRIHGGPGGSGMSGTVTVEAAATTTPPPTSPTPTGTEITHVDPPKEPGRGDTGPAVSWWWGAVILILGVALAALARRRAV